MYWMLQAAAEGRKSCVEHYLLVEGLDPCAQSEHCKYTALDWAEWSAAKGVDGAAEVAAYLRDQAPALQSRAPSASSTRRHWRAAEAVARETGLSTPIPESLGTRILERMGWVPGQALGSGRESGAPLEPLRPDTTRLEGPRHGLGYATE